MAYCWRFPHRAWSGNRDLVRSNRREIGRGDCRRDSVGPNKYICRKGRAIPQHNRAWREAAAIHGQCDGRPTSVSTAALDGEIELMAGAGRVVPVGGAITENLRELEFDNGLLPDTVIATAAAPVPRKRYPPP